MGKCLEELISYKKQGNEYFGKEQYSDAIHKYSAGILLAESRQGVNDEVKGEYINLLNNRGFSYFRQNHYVSARHDFENILRQNSDNMKAIYRLAMVFLKEKNYVEAMNYCRRAMQMDKSNKSVEELYKEIRQKMDLEKSSISTFKSKCEELMKRLMDDKKMKETEKILNTFHQLIREESISCRSLIIEEYLEKIQNLFYPHLPKLIDASRMNYQSINILGDMRVSLSKIQHPKYPIILALIRFIGSLGKNSTREQASKILSIFPINSLIQLMNNSIFLRCDDMKSKEFEKRSKELSTATAFSIQYLLMSFTELESFNKVKKRCNEIYSFDKPQIQLIDDFFCALIYIIDLISSKNDLIGTFHAEGRDRCMELMAKFISREFALGWSPKFVAMGLEKIAGAAALTYDKKNQVNGLCTVNTLMHSACVFAAVYDDCFQETEQNEFRKNSLKIVKKFIGDNELPEALSVVSALLQGPVDVGNHVINEGQLQELILNMLLNNEEKLQRLSIEVLVLSIAKEDKVSALLADGAAIMIDLYQTTKMIDIRVRCLFGLCKLASGTKDKSLKDNSLSSKSLFDDCRSMMLNSKLDSNVKKWVIESVAYLSLDPIIKETLSSDKEMLEIFFKLLPINEKKNEKIDENNDIFDNSRNIVYAISNIICNMTNSYDVKKMDKEMLELAKYTKQKIPEIHQFDQEEYVEKRCRRLISSNLTNLLYRLILISNSHQQQHVTDKSDESVTRPQTRNTSDTTTTTSENKSTSHGQYSYGASTECRELISRVSLTISDDSYKVRGDMVALGLARELISFTRFNTTIGIRKASQTLARIGITMNPELAFPGQRILELIRPLSDLLRSECDALENFEALMALTNMTQVSDAVIVRIMEGDDFVHFSRINALLFEEHLMLRRAAAECFCNMVRNDKVVPLFERKDVDRVKLMMLYTIEDDDEEAEIEEDTQIVDSSELLDGDGKVTEDDRELAKKLIAKIKRKRENEMIRAEFTSKNGERYLPKLAIACSGALAQLTEKSRKVCEIILEQNCWKEFLQRLIVSSHVELRHRGTSILNSIFTEWPQRSMSEKMEKKHEKEVEELKSRLETQMNICRKRSMSEKEIERELCKVESEMKFTYEERNWEKIILEKAKDDPFVKQISSSEIMTYMLALVQLDKEDKNVHDLIINCIDFADKINVLPKDL
ncbi:hypothetical protein SNEBB_009991 [Seison nebaliae]|nr:hypothetical protein SNEBB_009991 [Seison nebaliae]